MNKCGGFDATVLACGRIGDGTDGMDRCYRAFLHSIRSFFVSVGVCVPDIH